MGSVRICVGTEWLCDGRTYRVVRQLAPDRFIAQDVKFLVEQEFSATAILAHYAEGRLRFASGDSPQSASPPARPRPRTIQDLTEHGRQLLQRRWQALEPLTKLLGLPRESDYVLRSEAGWSQAISSLVNCLLSSPARVMGKAKRPQATCGDGPSGSRPPGPTSTREVGSG